MNLNRPRSHRSSLQYFILGVITALTLDERTARALYLEKQRQSGIKFRLGDEKMRQPKTAPEILNGWKEIANYLGKGVRTTQRYECELGLPVRRPARHSCSAVIATKAELDAWVAASPIREAYRVRLPHNAPNMLEFHRNVETLHLLVAEAVQLRQQLAESLASLQAHVASLTQTQDSPSTLQERSFTAVGVPSENRFTMTL